MSGLVLSLKPEEKFLINGTLLINGSKRAQIRIADEDTSVLRLSDALHPDQAVTPVRRAYYAAQLYLSGDVGEIDVLQTLHDRLNALCRVFTGTAHLETLNKACQAAMAGRYYSVLYALKPLLEIESKLLGISPLFDAGCSNTFQAKQRMTG